MTFDQLAKQVFERHIRYDPAMDLPKPNVYWVTINSTLAPPVHIYVAAAHTRVALQKACNWCADTQGFRPMKSNCRPLLRRLKLGDLMENPEVFQRALDGAIERGESDVIADLVRMPVILAQQLGLTSPIVADDVWQRLSAEISALPTRQLRA